jgi:Copper amine oxidase N-terminal domain
MKYRALSWQSVTLTAVAALAVSALLAFSRPATMMVDGERVESDVPPITTSSERAFVPIRTVSDALGAETVIDPKNGEIDVIRGNQSLRLKIGDIHATLNGMPMTLHHAPFRVRGRVMISLNTVAQAFNVRATYDPRTARIDILSPGIGQAPPASSTPGSMQ